MSSQGAQLRDHLYGGRPVYALRQEGEAMGSVMDFCTTWFSRLLFPVYLIYTPYTIGEYVAYGDYDWWFPVWLVVGPFMIWVTGNAWFNSDRYGKRTRG